MVRMGPKHCKTVLLGELCLVEPCPSTPMTLETLWLNTCYPYRWKYHNKNSFLQPGPTFSVHSCSFLCSRFILGSEYSLIPVQSGAGYAFPKSSG